jgi:hypothetical protein
VYLGWHRWFWGAAGLGSSDVRSGVSGGSRGHRAGSGRSVMTDLATTASPTNPGRMSFVAALGAHRPIRLPPKVPIA